MYYVYKHGTKEPVNKFEEYKHAERLLNKLVKSGFSARIEEKENEN